MIKLERLYRALTALGFKRDYDSRAGGERVVQLSIAIDTRRSVNVQLWAGGGHRASHDFLGCSDTIPSDFTTPLGILLAISLEITRMDSKWSEPGSLGTEKQGLALTESSTKPDAGGGEQEPQ